MEEKYIEDYNYFNRTHPQKRNNCQIQVSFNTENNYRNVKKSCNRNQFTSQSRNKEIIDDQSLHKEYAQWNINNKSRNQFTPQSRNNEMIGDEGLHKEYTQSNIINNKNRNQSRNKEMIHDEGLYKEYTQWNIISNRLIKIAQDLLSIKYDKLQTLKSVFSEWLIYVNEFCKELPKFEYLPIIPQNMDTNIEVLRKCLLKEELICENEGSENVLKILKNIEIEHLRIVPYNIGGGKEYTIEYDENKNLFKVEKFQFNTKEIEVKSLVEKNGLLETAKILLRYDLVGRGLIQSDNIDLYKEYIQWEFINFKLYDFGEALLNLKDERQKQEFKNTLQRWLIYINEHYNDVPKFEYFSILPRIKSVQTAPAAQFLKDAFVEKRFIKEHDANWAVENFLQKIEKEHSKVTPFNLYKVPLNVYFDTLNCSIVLDKFKPKNIPRLKLLIDKGGILATTTMLLRYESFGNGSYQWGDPKTVHKCLHDNYEVRYEGFASPLNSRFIEYKDTYFCSLFPETDEPFGSLGNFFHVDKVKHCGGWSVNPPFLNDLMKRVAEHIVEVLDENERCYFFCTFPRWTDDEGWIILNTSKHLLRSFSLAPNHFVVEDAYGKQLQPFMHMTLFVLGNLPNNCKLIELGKVLVVNPVNSKPAECDW